MLPDVERIYPMLSDVVRMLTMTTTIYRFMMIHDFTDLCNATNTNEYEIFYRGQRILKKNL